VSGGGPHSYGIDVAHRPDFSFELEACVRDNRYIDIRRKIQGEASRKIIDTEDRFIREGLIKLGWTPPPTESPAG
jgi:hypothetical protein